MISDKCLDQKQRCLKTIETDPVSLQLPCEGRCISRCVLWPRKTQPQVKAHPPALSEFES